MSDNLVSCSCCLCVVPNGFGYEGESLRYDTEAEAIAAWNTRAIDPAAIREAALREAAAICIGVSKDVWTQLGRDHERWMKATAEDCSKMILSRAALSERDKSHE